jgi:hypothetical protein
MTDQQHRRNYHFVIVDLDAGLSIMGSSNAELPDNPSDWSAATRLGEALRVLVKNEEFLEFVMGQKNEISQVPVSENIDMIKAALGKKQ